MFTFKNIVTPFNLGLTTFNQLLTIPNNVVTTFTTIRDVYLRIENEQHELKELKNAMVNAWRVYAQLFNIQLQCKEMEEFEDQLKFLIIWCYDMEDLIAEEALDSEKKKESFSQLKSEIAKPNKVKELKERFVRIVKQWEDILLKIKLVQGKKSKDPYLSRSRLPIGKEVDIQKCVEVLCSRDNGMGISIIGTCGLGKSLLAGTILNSQYIVNNFSQTKLVHINDGTFVWDDLKTEIEKWITDITTRINSSQKEKEKGNEEEEEQRKRKGKGKEEEEEDKNRAHNVLIVFDNFLRLGDDLEWGHFLVYLENLQKEKSINIKVIITTRNPSVSQLTFTTAYYLEVLSNDDCDELVKQNVEFFKASPSETMLSTAKSVAKFCEGIPWVTERIGNVIAQQSTEVDLRALEERVSSGHTSEFKEVILPRLSPCYIDMEPELRRCLAYLSLFPKNHSFDRATLAHLWVAECFFEMDKELTILQQIDKYVNELAARSILQLQPRGLCCKLQYCSQDFDELTESSILQLRPRGLCCKLQYCGQDFARLAASGTCLHLEQGGPPLSSLKQEVRHLSLSCKLDEDIIWTTLKDGKIKLRTFLSLYTDENRGHLGEIGMNLKESLSTLRVFSLTGTNVETLPEFIGALIHLRYLDISFTRIEEIPTKFPKNHPLQFLKFKRKDKNLPQRQWLPNEVHKLTNLRYVDWEEDFLRAKQVPPHIGILTHLENLPFFRVGTKEGHFISELGGMNRLQGSICIEFDEDDNAERDNRNLGRAKHDKLEAEYAASSDAEYRLKKEAEFSKSLEAENGKREAKKAMLHKKYGLRRIVLQWKSQSKIRGRDEGILRGLEPHSNVMELRIINYGGEEFPEWMTNSKLEKIYLKECCARDLPALEKMKTLKTLVLEDMENIVDLSCCSDGDASEFVSFPLLESMKCHNMTNLEKWTQLKRQDLPCLKELKFDGCTKINSSLPFIGNLKEFNPHAYISNEGICLRCNKAKCPCISSVGSTSNSVPSTSSSVANTSSSIASTSSVASTSTQLPVPTHKDAAGAKS